jgi:membrane dipeptidase
LSFHSVSHPGRRRFVTTLAGTAAALTLPAFGRAQTADAGKKYPKKVIDLVERSLVIDMLGPLKLDFTPAAYSGRLSDADAVMFRSSGITAFHNSIGVGGAGAYDDALSFLAAWSGFVGRSADVLCLVGRAEDIEAAKRQHKIAVRSTTTRG